MNFRLISVGQQIYSPNTIKFSVRHNKISDSIDSYDLYINYLDRDDNVNGLYKCKLQDRPDMQEDAIIFDLDVYDEPRIQRIRSRSPYGG